MLTDILLESGHISDVQELIQLEPAVCALFSLHQEGLLKIRVLGRETYQHSLLQEILQDHLALEQEACITAVF